MTEHPNWVVKMNSKYERGESTSNLTDLSKVVSVEAEEFLTTMWAKYPSSTDDALDRIYETFYKKLSNGEYAFCNHILKNLTSESYPLVILMGFLTASAPWKQRLPARSAFFKEVGISALGKYSKSKTTTLLKGLE